MAKCTENCPKCGADFDKVITEPDSSSRYWDCFSYERTFHDTTEFFNQSLRCENRCLKQQLAAANAEIERLRAREEPGRWFVTNRDQNDICIRGPYKYAETARRVREEMELYGRYAKRNTNLGVFNMPEEDHPHA